MRDPDLRRSLPLRDWLLLPLIAAVIAFLFLIATEGAARIIWPESKVERCAVGPFRPKANCVSRDKAAEGPWAETRFNACGYRGGDNCGVLSPGTARMVVIGSSISWGYLIPYDDLWSVKAAKTVSARCAQPLDIQSLAGFGNLSQIAARMPEAIALRPQIVALVIAPFDLLEMPPGGFDPVKALQGPPPAPPVHPGLMNRARSVVSDSRAATIAQHYAFGNAKSYAATYLKYGDRAAFLRPPMSQAWQSRLDVVDAAVGYISAKLKPTGAPLLVVYAPQQAQADLIASGEVIAGVDPRALDRAIAQIAMRHGARFADGAEEFRGLRNAPDYFYRADGHLNSAGQALLGRAAANAILASPPPGLCRGAAQ